MKKIMVILASLFVALPAFAENGENIDGVNYCNKVNRYDVSKVTSHHYMVQEAAIHIELLL